MVFSIVSTLISGFNALSVRAARGLSRRLFNLVVTNVPGPQFALYVLGRELQAIFPMVPLAQNTALGIAIMSYNGQMNFGLSADFDALPDLGILVDELGGSMEELVAASRSPLIRRRNGRSQSRPRATPAAR